MPNLIIPPSTPPSLPFLINLNMIFGMQNTFSSQPVVQHSIFFYAVLSWQGNVPTKDK